MEVVLACHVGLQPLRHLLDALNLIQQLEDVLVLDALDPQLPQLVPFAVEQHLAGQEVFLHLRERVERLIQALNAKACVAFTENHLEWQTYSWKYIQVKQTNVNL